MLTAGPLLAVPPPQKPPAEADDRLPPALNKVALAEELHKAAETRAEEQKAAAADRDARAKEKAALEKLRGEIEQARSALREETARLQKLVEKGGQCSLGRDKNSEPAGPQLDPVAKMVKSMKADQAASLIKGLGRPLATAILRRMKPADAGAVLDKLDTSLATELIEGLAAPQREARQ